MHSDSVSIFLSEAMENMHTVWKTILWITQGSGVAGMAVEKVPENLGQFYKETFWQTWDQK